MALLVDGKPFRLDDLAIKDYSRTYTYIFPKSAVRRRPDNGVIEAATGYGIPTEYRMVDPTTKREITVRYYESARWDDTVRKDVYSPDNILMENTGKMIVSQIQAELNWFLNNHPGLEDGPQRKFFPRYPVLFRLLNKPKDADRRLDRFRIRRELSEFIDTESKKSWKFDQLIAACEVLTSDNDIGSIPTGMMLPKDIQTYRDMSNERDPDIIKGYESVLRAALLELIDNYPEYAKDRLVLSVDRRIMMLINRADRYELTGVRYDSKIRKWVEQEGDKNVPFLGVPDNSDHKKHLLKECKKDPKLLEKIERYANLVEA